MIIELVLNDADNLHKVAGIVKPNRLALQKGYGRPNQNADGHAADRDVFNHDCVRLRSRSLR